MHIKEQKTYPSYMDYITQKCFENIDSIFDDACMKLDELKKEFEPKPKVDINMVNPELNRQAALYRQAAMAQNQAAGMAGFNGLYANRIPTELEMSVYNRQGYGQQNSYGLGFLGGIFS